MRTELASESATHLKGQHGFASHVHERQVDTLPTIDLSHQLRTDTATVRTCAPGSRKRAGLQHGRRTCESRRLVCCDCVAQEGSGIRGARRVFRNGGLENRRHRAR